MIKRIVLCVLCCVIAFSVNIYAESGVVDSDRANVQDGAVDNQYGNRPEEGQRPDGGMGGGGHRGGGPQGGMAPPQMPEDMQMSENNENGSTTEENGENVMPDMGGGQNQLPEMRNDRDMMQAETFEQTQAKESSAVKDFFVEYQTPVISMILLALAFVFVKFYKRKTY